MCNIHLQLCFRKGDIITITQREEGGWWEGTLGDKTGWFPSNYVKDYKTQGIEIIQDDALFRIKRLKGF
jgi:hypothetical protein